MGSAARRLGGCTGSSSAWKLVVPEPMRRWRGAVVYWCWEARLWALASAVAWMSDNELWWLASKVNEKEEGVGIRER